METPTGFPISKEFIHESLFGKSQEDAQVMVSTAVTDIINSAYKDGANASADGRANKALYLIDCKRQARKSSLHTYLLNQNFYKPLFNMISVAYDAGMAYGKQFRSSTQLLGRESYLRAEAELKRRGYR